MSITLDEGGQVIPVPSDHQFLRYFLQHPWLWAEGLLRTLKLLPHVNLRGFLFGFLCSVWLVGWCRASAIKKIHLEVGSGKYLVFSFLMSRLQKNIISYPHNIEFLVPREKKGLFRSKNSMQRLELQVYNNSTAVRTISRFDTAVLRCFGIDAVDTLAYSPVEEDRGWLSKIKRARVRSIKKSMLILGTVHNNPTKKGMSELLESIRHFGRRREFWLAGFGAEMFETCAPKNVKVFGSVDKETLEELMIHCEAIVIKQPATTGMLTRIVEALHADVPVYVYEEYLQAHSINDPNIRIISSIKDLP